MKFARRTAIILFFIGLLTLSPVFCTPAFSQTRDELEAELKSIEAQIAQYESELAKTKTEKKTLSNKISQLKAEQGKISSQIKSTNLQLGQLERQLIATESSIRESTQKIGRLQDQIAELIRVIYERDQQPLLNVILGEEDLSSFFGEMNMLEQIYGSIASAMEEIGMAKKELDSQHDDLKEKQDDKTNLLSIQMLQQQDLQAKTNEQASVLKKTQGKEASYQQMLSNSQKRAQEIKNRIYELLDVNTQISFGEAVEIARWVSGKTGIRTALLLAVLTQESNLGKNVGTCNRIGDPPSKSWENIMPGPEHYANYLKNGKSCAGASSPCSYRDDQSYFLTITKELGMDPDATPLSCPMQGIVGGWGGAMGPAQFIPSTWMAHRDDVAALTGKSPANPWDIRDAFVASALLLKANGAVAGNENSEWKAALRYFSGSTNVKYRFYGDNILALARQYEEDIKDME